MENNLTKKVVKIKKLQRVGEGLCVIIPKKWIDEMGWSQETKLCLEVLLHRKTMILSENIQPINSEIGIAQRDKRDYMLEKAENGKENSDTLPGLD